MDPLGAREDTVHLESLTHWNFTKLLDDESSDICDASQQSLFPYRIDINSKIILWSGDATNLDVHALVHASNELLNDDASGDTEKLYKKSGPELSNYIKNHIKVCKTGEARITEGYQLLARRVIHTVGPRYNVKYVTAAESALYSCYRNVLQLAREHQLRSIAMCPIHSAKRGYPVADGAHIGIRTVRRFLEHYGDDIDVIVFTCPNEIRETYEKILPLYFPRNLKEEHLALSRLPEDVGNETGEPMIAERQIRILDKPTVAIYKNLGREDFDETVDLNEEFASTSVREVGRHSFAQMEEDPDKDRKHSLYGKNLIEQKKLDQKRRYHRLLKRSKTEDLTEISALRCMYRTGVDKHGRPVIVLIGKHFPANDVDLEKALLYLIRILDPIAEQDYIIVYIHTLTSSENYPPMNYLKQVYAILDQKYKDNLKAFFIIHPTWWSKLVTWFFTTFTASDIKQKIFTLRGIQFLFRIINPDQFDVPAFVHDYDIQINGPRYFVPFENDTDGL